MEEWGGQEVEVTLARQKLEKQQEGGEQKERQETGTSMLGGP